MKRVNRPFWSSLILGAITVGSTAAGGGVTHPAPEPSQSLVKAPLNAIPLMDERPPEVCYAPGTSPEVIRANTARRQASMTSLNGPGFEFADTNRWSCTATDGCGLAQGQVTTLTWNIVPDGTPIAGFNGEPAAPSNLKGFLNSIYGSEATWLAHFQSVFDRWEALTGVNYIRVNTDDSAALSGSNPGVLGVRADVRIGGHFIDGDFNILAYNFFPNGGDMVIDTADAYYSHPAGGLANGSRGFKNMLAHEHGHGLGFRHSCPMVDTKLMEPQLSVAFEHAQLDDKLAGWRGYGDNRENNETAPTAANLGALGNGATTVTELSIDDNSDVDFYKFTVPAGKRAAVTVTPVGSTYLAGPQNSGDGTCSAGVNFNALAVNDLGVELRGTDGTTVLASANANGAGFAEAIPPTTLPGGGTFFVRASGGAANNVQGYTLTITLTDGATVSINDVSLAEGNAGTTNATFTVSLTTVSGSAVSVDYATTNGTALAGSDYQAKSGTLTIPAGNLNGTVTVLVTGDTILENPETFFLNLGNPVGAVITDGTGVATITNDDVGKTVCASGCDFTRIQNAINASVPGGSVLVRSTYDSFTSGEVFPIQTLAIGAAGAIRVTGENDGSGNPTTTVKTRSGPVDGFIFVSPGSVLANMRIVPGDATRVNRVIAAARQGGSCPGATCHLNGLTIQNVVIDFTVISGTGTAHFNTGNGIDLLADNVTIDKVTLKGIDANSIFVDGDNYSIQNSTLDGRGAGNVIRGDLAIGFGADEKLVGVVCSGPPTNYTINNNTIVGFADGIQWCTGKNNTISNNTITDISGKGVDTSGSQNTQIWGNVIQQNTTGGMHGIGLSNNAFQACTGNTVRNNKVLGRAARDMQRGIVVQSCPGTTIFQNEVRDFADNGGAIYVSMAAGVATATTIQGNTVIGGNAAGIVYFGADSGATAVDQSVIRDNVVNEFKKNGIVVQGIKGPRSGAGAGNVVAYNTVRAANMGMFGDTHAFNLQNLKETAFDRNTALDTKGAGIGFFLANSTLVNGNCNTGSTNGGGLFAQVNVNPVYGNANVNCRVALYSRYDFDGDGKSDPTMYRHTTGQWFTKSSSSGADSVLAFGAPGSDDIPAPGNYTTSSKSDHAIYRYTTGEWYIRRATDGGTTVIPFGSPLVGDVPMPADYDGDGLTDVAVFRTSTANAEWYIRRSSDGATQYVAWGCAACADVGVPGDYDGDGKADVAVYRRSTAEWFIRKSSDTTLQQVPYGDVAQGDIPVPGRYTQASKTDMAVYRSLTGQWYIRRSTDFGNTIVPFGDPAKGDFPVAADFTQAGITDIAIYRPTPPTAQFMIRRSTDFSTFILPYGNPGLQDAPLTAR